MPWKNLRTSPPTVTKACIQCGEMLTVGAPNAAQEVVGWLVPRSGGGANHIRQQVPTGRYKHVACLKEKEGEQGSLFDG